MNILITGGTGFIGSRLAQTLLRQGEEVRILGQVSNPAQQQNAELIRERGGEVMLQSVTDQTAVRTATRGIEVVYHLAAAQHEANVPDQHFRNVNVTGTQHMLEASADAGVRRFVHGSTIGVYRTGGGITVHEDSPTQPNNIYGLTKLEAERVVRSYQDRLPTVIIRISETYGPGDRRLLKLFKGIQKRRYFHIGRSANLHHPIYIDDLIEAFGLAATVDGAPAHTMVAAGFEAVTTRQMVATIAKIMGLKPPRLTVPLWPLWMCAVVMEKTLGPLGIQPPLHRRRMDFFVNSFKFSGNMARSVIGFVPRTSFVQGIQATAKWYAQMGYL